MSEFCIKLIGVYRKYLSPLKAHGCCRFIPTCSQYAIDALREWGFFRGMGLAILRLLRCNPLFRGGYDPVPVRRAKTSPNDSKEQ